MVAPLQRIAPVQPQSPRFHVVFSSAYFRLYVQSAPHVFTLVRHQTSVEGQIKPVLLFKSMSDAQDYATMVLGLSKDAAYVPKETKWYEFESKIDKFEVYTDDAAAPMLTKVYEPEPDDNQEDMDSMTPSPLRYTVENVHSRGEA